METIREKVTKTIVEEVVTFKAVDGTIFKDEEECKKYEESAKGVVSARYKGLVVGEFDSYCLMPEDWHYYDAVRIDSDEDVRAVNMYMNMFYEEVYETVKPSDIGKVILIEYGDCSDFAQPMGTLDNLISQIKANYIDKVVKEGE